MAASLKFWCKQSRNNILNKIRSGNLEGWFHLDHSKGIDKGEGGSIDKKKD